MLSLVPFVFLALAQVMLGADPIVVALALVGAAIGLGPYIVLDIDLLTLVPIIFFLRYTGVALLIKTVLLQPISVDLLYPIRSYGLVALLLTVVAIIAVSVRAVSPRKGLLPDIKSPEQLKAVVILGAALGLIGVVMNVGSASRIAGVSSTGAVNQIGAAMRPLFLLALVAETLRISSTEGRRRIVSPTLVGLLVAGVMISLAVNGREFSADCLIAVAATLLVLKRLKVIHFLVGMALIALFVGFISPVVLASRQGRTGQSSSQFIASTADIATQAATSPQFLNDLKRQKSEGRRERAITTQNDYYEGRADLADRLSWVSLVDTIYDAAESHSRLGSSGFAEVVNRLEPRFLFSDKPVERNTYSDYLAYQLGLERTDNLGAYSFGLPMEGFFSFGYLGFLTYTFVGVGALLIVTTLLSPLRLPQLFSIFFFVSFQHMMIEQTSDGFINAFIRGIPFLTLTCFLIIVATRSRIRPLRAAPAVRPFSSAPIRRHHV